MRLTVNGETRTVPDGVTLAQLLGDRPNMGRGTAIAVDDEVVPRTYWAHFALADGQVVEVLTAVQGG
jgi:sulfur carrier protein